MSARVAALALVSSALVLPGCANRLTDNTPVCGEASSALVLAAQALPGTAYVPCINTLKTDWMYQHLQARRGLATFTLGSVALGTTFLRVSLQPDCDTSSARAVPSDEAGAPLFVDVHDDDQLRVVVIPDGDGVPLSVYASELVGGLDGTTLADRTMVARLDARDLPVASRADEAHESAAAVLLVTVRDSERRTVTVLLPDEDEERTAVPADDLLETLRDVSEPAAYTGAWYYPFAHGCVVYRFDAHGSGVATIETDVKAALGLYDAEVMRAQARDQGYDVR